jgi:hypothetical protein
VIDYSAFFDGYGYLASKNPIASTKFTLSMWVKVTGQTSDYLFRTGSDTGLNLIQDSGGSHGQFYMHSNNNTGSSYSTARFADVSSWYHIVIQRDSDTSLIKYIINNSYKHDAGLTFDLSSTFYIGCFAITHSNFEGHMANIVLIDGQILEPSHFGETFEGNWIHKKLADDQDYGANGFYLNFADESDLGKDVSGNNKHFNVLSA